MLKGYITTMKPGAAVQRQEQICNLPVLGKIGGVMLRCLKPSPSGEGGPFAEDEGKYHSSVAGRQRLTGETPSACSLCPLPILLLIIWLKNVKI